MSAASQTAALEKGWPIAAPLGGHAVKGKAPPGVCPRCGQSMAGRPWHSYLGHLGLHGYADNHHERSRDTNIGGEQKGGRVYLLHRVVRCFHCGCYLYVSPNRNAKGELIPQYKEPGKVLLTDCPAAGRHVIQDRVDVQIEALVKRLKLPADWRERLEELNEHQEERQGVEKRRAYLQGKLRRLRELYIDGDFDKPEYDRRKGELQDQLDALAVPDAPDVMEAGATLKTLGQIWEDASLRIRRDMLRTIFEGIYVNMQTARVVYVKPWLPFVDLFRMDGLEEKEDGCFYYQEDQEARSEG